MDEDLANNPALFYFVKEIITQRDAVKAALTKLVSSFEGDALPFTDEQERAYEEAAFLLDALSASRSSQKETGDHDT